MPPFPLKLDAFPDAIRKGVEGVDLLKLLKNLTRGSSALGTFGVSPFNIVLTAASVSGDRNGTAITIPAAQHRFLWFATYAFTEGDSAQQAPSLINAQISFEHQGTSFLAVDPTGLASGFTFAHTTLFIHSSPTTFGPPAQSFKSGGGFIPLLKRIGPGGSMFLGATALGAIVDTLIIRGNLFYSSYPEGK